MYCGCSNCDQHHCGESQLDLLQYAFVKTIETLDQLGDRATAQSWVALGDDFVGGDREYEAVKRSLGL